MSQSFHNDTHQRKCLLTLFDSSAEFAQPFRTHDFSDSSPLPCEMGIWGWGEVTAAGAAVCSLGQRGRHEQTNKQAKKQTSKQAKQQRKPKQE